MTIPFTYTIKFLKTNQIYYGVKFAKNCKPEDLGTKYFSSSKYVKSLIKEHGIEFFEFTIRKTFEDLVKAQSWEHRLLKKVNAKTNTKFLNRSNGYESGTLFFTGNKGCNNPAYGKPGTMLGKKHTPQAIEKIKLATAGESNGFYGKKHTKEIKQFLHEKFIGVSNNAGSSNPMYGVPSPFTGKKHTEESKQKCKNAALKQHANFIKNKYKNMIFHTPHGVFDNPVKAKTDTLGYGLIVKYCNQPDKIISHNVVGLSKYFTRADIGKTYKEAGFYLETTLDN